MKTERDRYKEHRDELAMALGKNIGEAMDEHMNGGESNSTDQDEKSESEMEMEWA